MLRLGIPGVSVLAFCCLMFAQGCSESGNEPPPPTPAAIEVEPASLELFVGESRDLSATVYDSAGDELAVQVAWVALTPSVASVNAAGAVAGLSPGNATVRASAGVVTEDIAITVSEVPPDPPASIVVEPASLELEVGQSGDLSAAVFDSAGQELQTLVTWESLHPLVASVNTAGRVTGLSVGSADVVASAGDVTAEAAITVRAADLGVYGRCPVLFVHGSGLSSQSFEGMIQFLELDGYPSEYLHAVDLVPSNGANRTAATQFIAPAVEGLLGEARAAAAQAGHPTSHLEQVCIVAHSMGAASSRWYLANLRPDRVVVWISIAGSNHGTDALEGIAGEGNLEMVPAFAESDDESSFQVELNGTSQAPTDESPFGLGMDPAGAPSIPPDEDHSIAYFTIRIDPDEWIKPEASALLTGAGGVSVDMPPGLPIEETSPGNFLANVATIHDGLPYDPSIQTLVASLLRVADE